MMNSRSILHKGILMIPFLCFIASAISAQDYSQMPKQVQVKMDQNKAAGKEILSGIAVEYEIIFGGVNSQKSAEQLKETLVNNFTVSAFSYNHSSRKVNFTVPAKTSLESLKEFIKSSGFEINYVYKQEYRIEK